MVSICSLVDFIDTFKLKFKFEDGLANDLGSGNFILPNYIIAVFNFGVYIGEAIGPLIGGYYGTLNGAGYCVSFIHLAYGVIFFVYNKQVIIESINEFNEKVNKTPTGDNLLTSQSDESMLISSKPSHRRRISNLSNIAKFRPLSSYSGSRGSKRSKYTF